MEYDDKKRHGRAGTMQQGQSALVERKQQTVHIIAVYLIDFNHLHVMFFQHIMCIMNKIGRLLKHLGAIATIWGLASLFSYAVATPLLLDSQYPQPIELGPHYLLYVDSQHSATIEDILSPKNAIEFSPLVKGKFNLGYRPETHWFKVSVNNASPHELKQLLEFNFPLLDDIGVYVVNKTSQRILSRYDGGDTRPFHRRVYQHPNFIFPLTLPAQTKFDFYFRIKSKGSMTAGATLWQPDIFPEQNRLEYFYISLYIGLLIGLMAYNLLLFFSLSEVTYLFYVLFSGSMLFAIGSFNGLWFELLWPNLPLWHNLSVPISFGLTGLFAALFSKSFLQTISNAPTLNHAFSFIAFAFASTALASPFVSLLYIAPIISVCALALAATSIFSGLILSLKGDRFALIYLIAWVLFMIGTALFSARNVGWLPNTVWTRYGIVFGSALEMILLSFALAQRINYLSQESHNSRQETFKTKNSLIEVLKNSERELLHRVKKRTEALEDANQKLLNQEDELKKLAHYDPLTGLANRTLITEQLHLLITRCKREKIKLAVLFLDLDGFKAVNDKYGHKIGDDLLVSVANRLRKALRNSDVIGRLGGDEFIVLIETGNGELEPEQVATKIKKSLSQRVSIDGYSVQIGVSIGIAVYPDDGESLDTLMSVSDTKMYSDKNARKKDLDNELSTNNTPIFLSD